MPRILRLALIAALLAPFGVPLSGQTLADVARKEEERRRTVKAGARTISNRDLQSVPSTMAAASTPADQASGGVAQPDAQGGARAAAKGDDKKAGDAASAQGQAPAKDEKSWRTQMTQLKTQLERDKMLAEALQTRINSLTTDYVNRDDPAQRSVLAAERQKSVDELARLKKAVVDGTKAITALEEDARRAGVPPGWLR